ncbi:MAG: hypothetical protein KF767_02825 [Bdellovibrionaceae bacterium]|nr:hypothetical protein [Pseudobdellovibrionaceae bacterium]
MVRYWKSENPVWHYVQIGLVISFFAVVLSSGLAACGKKSSDGDTNLNVGSLTSDGYAVSSNTTLSGYPVSLTISNIQPTGTGHINNQCYWNGYQQVCNQQANCYNQYGQYICGGNIGGYSSLIFTVQINGQSQQLSAAMNTNGGYTQRSSAQVGGFQVLYQAACYTTDCADVALEVVIGGTHDYRQIGIRRSNSQGKIVKLGEWQLTWNTLSSRSIQQMMTELQ